MKRIHDHETTELNSSGIREAILAAADHIERNPNSFWFMEPHVPETPRKKGCALGWIGYFFKGPWSSHREVSIDLLGMQPDEFYRRLVAADLGCEPRQVALNNQNQWMDDHEICVRSLRRFVDKYYPEAA